MTIFSNQMMTTKPLLILHNGTQRSGSDHIAARFRAAGLPVDSFWAYNSEFPATLDGYCGLFLTGSPHGAYEHIPFIQREHELLQEVAKRPFPTLGICFGSQILASALCGRDQVFRRPSCEVGYKTLPLTPAAATDPLTQQLGPSVHMLVWHNDEIRADHPHMTILASSDQCPNQIWRYRNLPIWGIQGHPELTQADAHHLFTADRDVFLRDGADLDQLHAQATDAPLAKKLLENFARICLQTEIGD